MEPVTHVLIGACLARTGWNRRAAYATVGMAIAAEFPDIDTLWSVDGPVAGFQHHRGITHTFLGIPFEAGLILLGIFLVHQIRARRRASLGSTNTGSTRAAAPVRWGLLYCLLLLALLSHLLLDYTNNYGLRPFFPFDTHWYAASIVFIFDPLMFGLLLAALVLPSLFGLIGREVGARRERFRGRGWARAGLLGVLLLWSVRWVEHRRAVALAQDQTLRAPGSIEPGAAAQAGNESISPGTGGEALEQPAPEQTRTLLPSLRSLASPDPLSVFRWYTATDFGPAIRLGVADTHNNALDVGEVLEKPQSSPALLGAERSLLGRVYLDWSSMPVLRVNAGAPASLDLSPAEHSADATVVFTDPRFMGDVMLLRGGGSPPLTGEVVLDPADHVIAEGMDGRFAH